MSGGEWRLSETLRSLRNERGMTQGVLSEDIVDPSTISRYENDVQVPTRRNFSLLMQRLGATDFTYGDFTDYETYILREHQLSIRKKMLSGDMDAVEDMLDTLLFSEGKSDTDIIQYVGFFMLTFTDEIKARERLRAYLRGHRPDVPFPIVKRQDDEIQELLLEYEKLLCLSCKWYGKDFLRMEDPEAGSIAMVIDSLNKRSERIKKKAFTFSEARIINALGINYARRHRFKTALFHFMMLPDNFNKVQKENNIALCCSYLGKREYGIKLLKSAERNLITDSDIMTALSIYRSVHRILTFQNDASAARYFSAIACLFDLHRDDIKMSLPEFMLSSDFLQMY